MKRNSFKDIINTCLQKKAYLKKQKQDQNYYLMSYGVMVIEHYILKLQKYQNTLKIKDLKQQSFQIHLPSLQYSLEQLEIDKYFDSFIASSLVGTGKPSPIIFNAALDSVGVKAEESLYVDDYKPEADGARLQGFTSFLIDRSIKEKKEWEINSLKEIINFVEKLEE